MGLFDKLREPVFLGEKHSAQEQIEVLNGLKEKAEGKTLEKIEEQIRLLKSGIIGEQAVRFELEHSHIPMYVLSDLFLEWEGKTAQIDYLLITRRQTFVIECKNLYGDITIDADGSFHRCTVSGKFRKKEGMYSPITQNRHHLDLIRQIRAEEKNNFLVRAVFEKYFEQNYLSLVVLANPKTVLTMKKAPKAVRDCVVRVDQLAETIRKAHKGYQGVPYSDKEMKALADFFLNLDRANPKDYTERFCTMIAQDLEAEQRARQQIAEREQAGPTVLCPQCGSPMVLRTAKRGEFHGNRFYGCSSYPKCRAIINIEENNEDGGR